MQNTLRIITKRPRAHTASLPITPSKHGAISKTLNIDAVKQKAAQWEPTVDLKDLILENKDGNGNNETRLLHMTTFSAFDPSASHPLLLSTSLPMSLSSLSHAGTLHDTISAPAQVQNPPTTSNLRYSHEVQQAGPVCSTTKFTPWPYSLPKALRPKVGTTYDLMYGDGCGEGPVARVKLSMLQKVLYGVPGPGE